MLASENIKIVLAKAGQSSAGTDVNSDGIDMTGFQSVTFLGSITTSNAANFAKVQQGADNSADWEDLAGTKVVPGDDGDSFRIEVKNPGDRYVRCVVDRGGANTATGDIYAILTGPSKAPVTDGTTIDGEAHVSPDEGTA